ncbi:MAG: helix-turn-helix domain-containing protein [Candidatus Azobacteroides sp.]|nr:helix-turn-helix domain-containing protein [Candidatus Azobacteroides sp.]
MEIYLNKVKALLFIGFLGLLSIIYSFFSIFLFTNNFVFFAFLQCFSLSVNLFLIVFIWYSLPAFQKLIVLHPFYMFICYLAIILNALLCYQSNSVAAIYYLSIPPCVILFLTNGKVAFVYSLVSLAALIITGFLKYTLRKIVIIQFTTRQLQSLERAQLISFFSLVIYSFFSIFRMERAKDKLKRELERENNEAQQNEKDKYSAIYEGIVTAMEQERMWRSPNLSELELAEHLNTNVNYIYYAIKYYGKGENFSNMINRYRVQAIKERILQGEGEKFTINHLYSQSGFKYQSTFNRVFKQFEGVTPKEYIKLAKSHKRKNGA